MALDVQECHRDDGGGDGGRREAHGRPQTAAAPPVRQDVPSGSERPARAGDGGQHQWVLPPGLVELVAAARPGRRAASRLRCPRHRFSAAHLWRSRKRVRQESREDGSSKRFRRPDLDADPLRIGRGGHAAGQPLLSDSDLSPVLRRAYRAGAGRDPLRSRRLQRVDPEPRRLGGAA